MRQREITKRQMQVYQYILEKIRERGYGPTVREIGEEFQIKSPNGVICHLQALVKKGMITREPGMSRAISVVHEEDRTNGIPLLGTIAAGQPLETYEMADRIDFGEVMSKAGDFALKVRGESMIEDHIEEGDYVVVRKTKLARDGQIVVALVDGSETTLKRFYREEGKDGVRRIRLVPANKTMKPIIRDQVEVLGVVVGVVRRV